MLALYAWTQIWISGEMLQVPWLRFTVGDFAYPWLLLASVVYLHWLFRVFLMPLSHLGREQRERITQQALAQYSKGFLSGTVGLGYLLLALYIVGFLTGFRGRPITPNLVWAGVFFIAVGTLAQVRGLVRWLSGDSGKEIDRAPAPYGGPTSPLGPSGMPSGPPPVLIVRSLDTPCTIEHHHPMKRRTFLKATLAAVPFSLAAAPAPAERPKRAIRVAAGDDRFSEHIKLGGAPNDCKVSAQDTDGALCVFEFTSPGKGGPPRHIHHDQDEWIYVMDGEFDFQIGEERFRARPGESVFAPRKVAHVWACVSDKPGKIMNVFQPAGNMEAFFREIGKFRSRPSEEEFQRLFRAHGMEIVGPPLSTGQ